MPTSSENPSPRIDPKFCCFRLQVRPSKIHRWGVYADQDIPRNCKVIEYTGERIEMAEAERRTSSSYLFVLDNHWVIDGGVGGSGAEFINHSCEPNLVTRILKGHILYMSQRPIRKGTIILVTHEHDISQFARRVLVFRDGKIRKDEPVLTRPKAADVLKTMPTLED